LERGKEIHFFHCDEYFKGYDYYKDWFKECDHTPVSEANQANDIHTVNQNERIRVEQLTIDGTPKYIHESEIVIKRLFDTFNSQQQFRKKFIIVYRDPILREFAQYRYQVTDIVTQHYEKYAPFTSVFKLPE
jgi:hypothetical protein